MNRSAIKPTKEVKTALKIYPNGMCELRVYKEPIFVAEEGWETDDDPNFSVQEYSDFDTDLENKLRSIRRTKQTVKDYVLSNGFDMFWTLTYATNRESDVDCIKRMQRWVKRKREKYGKFPYIIIPERHKNGCLHFHMLTKGYKGSIVDSGKKNKGGQIVYNADSWSHGFSTVVKINEGIEDVSKVASYVTKYITKQIDDVHFGKNARRYWSSKGLLKPKMRNNVGVVTTHLDMVFEKGNLEIYQFKYSDVFGQFEFNDIIA